jgi:hypothetical protein
MPAKPPINPKLIPLYEAAKKLAATKAKIAKLEKTLAAWPTKKVAPDNSQPSKK